MKIGILTVPFNNNYGGFLQAYALSTILKRMGHEVIIINRRRNRSFKQQIKRILSLNTPSQQEKTIGKISVHTQRFISEYLKITPPLYSTCAIKNECRKQHFDCFIVGSDQVWRYKYAKRSIDNFFLGFLSAKDQTPRFSYAASFGVDFQEYPQKELERCAQRLRRFRSISVREASAVDLLEKYFGLQSGSVEVVCDPTLLLSKEDYYKLCVDKGNVSEEKYVFKYILDDSEETEKIQCRVIGSIDLPSRQIKAQTGDITQLEIIAPIEQWLAEIAEAAFVVTDSYHGTVFSILFNRPFVVISNPVRGITRIEHLLRHFHLHDRMIVQDNAEQLSDILNTPIKWDEINKQIISDRTTSLNYIKCSLPS